MGKIRSSNSGLANRRGCIFSSRADKPSSSRRYARDFYLILRSEFASISLSDRDRSNPDFVAYSRLVDEIDEVAKSDPYALNILEVFEVEMALIRILPEEAVRAKIWSARSGYRKLVGETLYRQYLETRPPDPADRTVPLERVRADLVDLVKGTHWWHANAVVVERGMKDYKMLLVRALELSFALVLAGMLLAVGARALGVDACVSQYAWVVNVLVVTACSGMAGAIISMARRISLYVRVPLSDTDPVIRVTGLGNGETGLRLSIMSGAVFSLVLYFLFVAGFGKTILSGELIPEFPGADACLGSACEEGSRVAEILCGMIPVDSAALARLVIWSFVAGFAERFVPDILDSLAGRAGRRRDDRKQEDSPGPAKRDEASPAGRGPNPAQSRLKLLAAVERHRRRSRYQGP
jgi:hypothetical protein